jgi:hypothetical protein
MDDCKMDFSSAKPSISKATQLLMRTKGKKMRVFSDWRYNSKGMGLPWSECWINTYVKAWV